MDNWYSVEDKLPEDVLPYSNAKHATIKVLVYMRNKKRWVYKNSDAYQKCLVWK